MNEKFSRFINLIGTEKFKKLANCRVAVFGIGGVGGHCVLALARAGVGKLTLVDNDVVSISNINRQAVAFCDTVGKQKTEVMKEMLLKINPDIKVETKNIFFLPETKDEFDFSSFDYIRYVLFD